MLTFHLTLATDYGGLPLIPPIFVLGTIMCIVFSAHMAYVKKEQVAADGMSMPGYFCITFFISFMVLVAVCFVLFLLVGLAL